MDMEYKLDYLSDLLVEQIFKFDDRYDNLSDTEKGSVKLGFHLDLSNNNIIVTDELIETVKAEFPSSPMAQMLMEYIQLNAVSELETGRKVTMIKFSEFGFPQLIQTVIDSVKFDLYAQYNNALYISHKPKRKRSNYTEVVLPHQEVMIYDGWIDFDIDSVSHITIKSSQSVTVRQSKYTSFDPQFMIDLRSTLSIIPLVTINPKKELTAC